MGVPIDPVGAPTLFRGTFGGARARHADDNTLLLTEVRTIADVPGDDGDRYSWREWQPIRREPSPMGHPQLPQYGPPPGSQPPPPSSASCVVSAIFAMLSGLVLLLALMGTTHIAQMPDRLVVMWLLRWVVAGGMIAGSIVLLVKKYAGVFVIAGSTAVYFLILLLTPLLLHIPLGVYVDSLFSSSGQENGGTIFVLIFVGVALGCGLAPSTRRYLQWVNAHRSQTARGMSQPQQPMQPFQVQQQPQSQWGQYPQPHQVYPQQYPQSGQQPQHWYPGPR